MPETSDKLSPAALAILGASRVVDLKNDAADLAALCIEPPLPSLSGDLTDREQILLSALIEARAAVRLLRQMLVAA